MDLIPQLEIQGRTMGTTYSVKLVSEDLPDSTKLKSELDAALLEINHSLSTYIEDSELSIFNKTEINRWQPASEMMLTVLISGREIFNLSKGAFDPTIGPLVNLWGFGPEMSLDFPDENQIQSALGRVGYGNLVIDQDKKRINKTRDLYLDLSAIAKGFAVDQLSELLSDKGFAHYLVEIGGEIRSAGLNAESLPWRIAIEKPQAGARQVHGVLNVSDKGMATSGDYRNFFEKDGRRYSHTIDPRTGYPVDHGLVSVTVLAPDSMTADAMATAFMVMGAEAGYVLAVKEELAVWFIELKDGKLVDKLTPKMQSYRLH